jgi:phosphoribosylformylglycinamidine synthase
VTARIGVVVFPGTNCEHDVVAALEVAAARWAESAGQRVPAGAELVWHGQRSLGGFDAVVLPGGFAHGDYLRPGAIARFSPVMEAVAAFANDGGPVVGICNGFQVLTEAGLLPGALQKNRDLRFLCTTADIEVCTTRSVLTSAAAPGARLAIPINHFEGNYTCDAETLAALADQDRIVFRYTANPNGSTGDIAGVCNAEGNVVGLMPHPERASDALLGSVDGLPLLTSLVLAAADRASMPAA